MEQRAGHWVANERACLKMSELETKVTGMCFYIKVSTIKCLTLSHGESWSLGEERRKAVPLPEDVHVGNIKEKIGGVISMTVRTRYGKRS